VVERVAGALAAHQVASDAGARPVAQRVDATPVVALLHRTHDSIGHDAVVARVRQLKAPSPPEADPSVREVVEQIVLHERVAHVPRDDGGASMELHGATDGAVLDEQECIMTRPLGLCKVRGAAEHNRWRGDVFKRAATHRLVLRSAVDANLSATEASNRSSARAVAGRR